MGRPVMGHEGRLGIGDSAGTATKELFFVSADFGMQEDLLSADDEAHGFREGVAEPTCRGGYRVSGNIVMRPRPDELAHILASALGGVSGSVYTPATPLIGKCFQLRRGPTVDHKYVACKINTLRLESSAAQRLQATIGAEGTSEETASFPDIASTRSVLAPYVHHELVLTVDGTERRCHKFAVVLNNQCILDYFANSESRLEIPEGKLMAGIEMSLPFTDDEVDLYPTLLAGVSIRAVYTKGGNSLTIEIPKFQAPRKAPTLGNVNGETTLELNGAARYDVTNDLPSIKFTLA